ncbi:3-deoxy-manno-octulosonate cytidylyltransferase [Vibrio barjaei]|uniref:3-deoxy-manno-octulosonate cytidylyltransferase n=1 Tax=Vibrio barjaei TaxID=1676683 RepID=UPI0022841B96|nr:3-deoxy-manno-octulosonate cytidylyltransferase [Vibrio barjaei]MCY9872369.1 3-deoxy-manno-octulosonate cytidylyltransferase [Vibrio barjaei]
MNNVHVIIPARYNSSRLPKKPLLEINGMSMVMRVYNQAKSFTKNVIVATDSIEILEHVEKSGGKAIMTDEAHDSGTKRIVEVVNKLGLSDSQIVLNLQGDEPFVNADHLSSAVDCLNRDPVIDIATLITPITTFEQYVDSNVVKVVSTRYGIADYFSRAPIPFNRDGFEKGEIPKGASKHIGLYGYRVSALKSLEGYYKKYPEAIGYEDSEKLEQLGFMDAGLVVGYSVTLTPPHRGIDTLEDLERARAVVAE